MADRFFFVGLSAVVQACPSCCPTAPFGPPAQTLSEPLPQTAAYEAFAGMGVLDRAAAVLPLLLGSGATLRQPVDVAIAIDNTNVTTGVPVRGDTLEEITRGMYATERWRIQ